MKKTITYHVSSIRGNGNWGFTIVELLLYMGLLTIFLGMILSIFTAIVDVQLESEGTSALEQDSRYIFARLAYDVGRAQTITIPASPGQSATSLQLTIDGAPSTYSLNNGVFSLANTLGTNALNSINTTVSSVTFLRLGNADGKQTVRTTIAFASVHQRSGGGETKTMQETFGLR